MKIFGSVSVFSFMAVIGLAFILSCGGGDKASEEGLGTLYASAGGSAISTQDAWCGEGTDDPGQRFLPLVSSFQLLPPLGWHPSDEVDADRSLLDYLTVSVCRIDGEECEVIAEFTSQTEGKGPGHIVLEGDQYHLNWKVEKDHVGLDVEIHFALCGIDMAYVTYAPMAPRSLPIKFRIGKNALLRAIVLDYQGMTAVDVAEQLVTDFTVSAVETAWILKVLRYGITDIYLALTEVLGVTDVYDLEVLFEDLCYPEDQYLSLTALPVISRFTPVLKFDQAYHGLPMSADVYFNAVMSPVADDVDGTITWYVGDDGPPSGSYWDDTSELYWFIVEVCGKSECDNGMSNEDFQTLRDGKVPTYFKVVSDKEGLNQGRLRIAYWWFYGFQTPCQTGPFGSDGAHHGDWEHIVVTTNPDRTAIEAVTYYFHSSHYTRLADNYETWDGERPVAYVGKTAHGSYHSRDHSGWMIGTPSHCCDYADYRNPNSESVWTNANDNLVSVSLDEESWMLADKIGSMYEYKGQEYEISDWRWGPYLSYCNWDMGLLGCWDWEGTEACGTHPTLSSLDWSFPSCSNRGCNGYTFICAYSARYNQDWPIDYSTTAQAEEIELSPTESLSQVTCPEASYMPE